MNFLVRLAKPFRKKWSFSTFIKYMPTYHEGLNLVLRTIKRHIRTADIKFVSTPNNIASSKTCYGASSDNG